MSSSGQHHRDSEDMIIDPDHLSNRDLLRLSQRTLSKRLPSSTSTRATLSLYLRWLEVHRTEPSPRTEHWSNTVMHWAQSLASRRFGVETVVREVERWKCDNGPFHAKPTRSPPTEGEIRKAFEEDPKTFSERRVEKMGDSYRPESRRENERERQREWERERRLEDSRGEGRAEESRKETHNDRHFDKMVYDGPPPPNYICNRCDRKGHYLQVCPTNLDPTYDRPPDENYRCEICHQKGHHFKSLCPKNGDPYSIIQKRKAKGITASTKGNDHRRDGWERSSKEQIDRENDRLEKRSRLTDYSSSSSARNTPSSSRKLELLESLQEIEARKQRLFCEQSDDIGDMIRDSTAQKSSDCKRNYGAASIGSPTSNTIQAQKKARKSESEPPSSDGHFSHRSEYGGTSSTSNSFVEDLENSDTEMIGYKDGNGKNSKTELHPQSASEMPLRPRAIGMPRSTMTSAESSSDEMEIDEPNSRTHKDYSPFVQKLMRRRPEMNDEANVVKRRKTAREMWKEADQLRKQQPSKRTTSESHGCLTPIAVDEAMRMQYDGACDNYHYHYDYDRTQTQPQKGQNPSQDQKQTSASKETYTLHKPPPNFTPTSSSFRTSNQTSTQIQIQSLRMSPSAETKPEISTTTPTKLAVHFLPRDALPSDKNSGKGNDRDVASAFEGFAAQQRGNVEAVHIHRARPGGPKANLQALKDFSANFKLRTPIPRDLVGILSNNPEKQKQIEHKAQKDSEEFY